MLGRLVTHWPDIVGKDLAAKAHPARIRYRKVPGQKNAEAALDIGVSTADATLLHYRVGLILERINQIFGEQIVTSIRFVPMASNEKKPSLTRFRKKSISPKDREDLANILENIDDPELKQRLEVLGTSILQDS